ncbi:MAG: arginine--tRNA ligase, partial [Treponema sp.]|nr:arginine--tRNA ligase [Treponema sp.]
MYDYKEVWKQKIAETVTGFLKQAGLDESVDPAQVVAEVPPSAEMGDLGFPMFAYAKLLRKGPPQIAQMVASELPGSQAVGPYLNVRLNRGETACGILTEMLSAGRENAIGRPETLRGKRVMVEFSSPNTNKPLHLGHLRNDVLGESVSRILAACGAEVRKVCII